MSVGVDTLKARGQALSDAGDLDGAEAAWRQALGLAGADVAAHLALGRLLYRSNRRVESIFHLQTATAAGAGGIKALRWLAAASRQAGALQDAEAAWRRAIALGPEDAEAHAGLGALLLEAGRPAEASFHGRSFRGRPRRRRGGRPGRRDHQEGGDRPRAAQAQQRRLRRDASRRQHGVRQGDGASVWAGSRAGTTRACPSRPTSSAPSTRVSAPDRPGWRGRSWTGSVQGTPRAVQQLRDRLDHWAGQDAQILENARQNLAGAIAGA